MRHGYLDAMATQIDHGIFGFCGAQVTQSELTVHPGSADWSAALTAAEAIGRNLSALSNT